MAHQDNADQPRAEELIVEIYRQVQHVRASGRPTRVVLNRVQYDLLQAYRARLGELPDEQPDYLEKYAIFGLELHVDACSEPRVE